MGLIEDFASLVGLPPWFVGGLIGYIIMLVAIALTMRFLKARSLMLGIVIISIMFLNLLVFLWPLWSILVVGVGLLLLITRTSTLSIPSLRVTLLRPSKLRLLSKKELEER